MLTCFEEAQERLYVLWRCHVQNSEHAILWAQSLQRLTEQEGECEYLIWLLQTYPDIPYQNRVNRRRAPPIKRIRHRDHHYATSAKPHEGRTEESADPSLAEPRRSAAGVEKRD